MRKRAMNWDLFIKRYKPIKNELADAPIDGLMFETYGKEFKAVLKANKRNPFTIWTVVDGTSDHCYAIPGYHFVNRLGYFICEAPFTKEEDEKGLTVKI